MRSRSSRLFALAICSTLACTPTKQDTATPEPSTPAPAVSAAPQPADFAEVLASPHRSAENKTRDAWRHPAETLSFFEVRKDAKVVELWPGGGWYTEILGPWLKDEGALTVTIFDPA